MAAGRICGHHQSPMVLATQTTGFRTPSVRPQLTQLALGCICRDTWGTHPPWSLFFYHFTYQTTMTCHLNGHCETTCHIQDLQMVWVQDSPCSPIPMYSAWLRGALSPQFCPFCLTQEWTHSGCSGNMRSAELSWS